MPEAVRTDKLWSYGVALRELSVLHNMEYVQVVPTARCNNLDEQSHRPTQRRVRQQRGFSSRQQTQGFLSLY
ncbi:DDE-type integrase/transposase/recombinase, partial [Deinococcus marmoris]